MKNLIFLVFDSCRYDSFVQAKTPNLDRLGQTQRCYSYASWTLPSHAVYLMGIGPHQSPAQVFASEVYKEEYLSWAERLELDSSTFKDFIPELSLARFLKAQGYRNEAYVSLPVLNSTTFVNQHFANWELVDEHNNLAAILDRLSFSGDSPYFYFINTGETHYPYTLPGETAENLPHLHGLHGVAKRLGQASSEATEEAFFPEDVMKNLHQKQIRNVEHLDTVIGELYQRIPENTYIIVTSDHGELFGEGGYFGHGPIFHEKVFEVFLVEGSRPIP